MPLHNTEELKAAPTSQLESAVLNEETESYEFPETAQDPQTVYRTIHDQLVLDGTRGRFWLRFALPGSNPK